MTYEKGSSLQAMSSDTPNTPQRAPAGGDPDWANGLRQLYDSVVEEPLPDSFQDLLDKLDVKD
ncbi:MAG TPA: hypothetical protein DFK13_07910 [Erythrobacter sp.]|nr:hypothetical protein [Erythrobacter sp.]